MIEVRYPAYRDYDSARIIVNDAMNALLVGSRLGTYLLAEQSSGDDTLLSAIFPTIEHINRFNVRRSVAVSQLAGADHHFAAVAIPYILSVQEHFVKTSLATLREDGLIVMVDGSPLTQDDVNAQNMHGALLGSSGIEVALRDLQLFEAMRLIRNCFTHRGGQISGTLRDHIHALSQDSAADWREIVGARPVDLLHSDPMRLTAGHAFLAFAVVKRLGRAVNAAMQVALSKESWAAIAVDDFASSARQARNSLQWRRALGRFANRNYGPIALSNTDLESAARVSGVWSGTAWD